MTHAPKPDTMVACASPGLEGVIAAHTVLSDVDGQNGTLILRGHKIEDLAGVVPFEEAAARLWQGLLPADDLRRRFSEARLAAQDVLPVMKAVPGDAGILERMQAGLAVLSIPNEEEAAVSVSGALPVLLAAAFRMSKGGTPVAPDPELGTAEDLLRMLSGAAPDATAARQLDRYLVTILDHGLNASTFAARVIASTGADIRQSVIGAMGALSGPLHGGAPGPVLDMIDSIGTKENAKDWITTELENGNRLMGFGHRIYRTRDPRADVLKAGLGELPKDNTKIKLAEVIENAALDALSNKKPDRALKTNVEFYTAVLLDAIGIDRHLFTPLFAVGRTPGWCVHAAEQVQTGKLIRPASRYVGP